MIILSNIINKYYMFNIGNYFENLKKYFIEIKKMNILYY